MDKVNYINQKVAIRYQSQFSFYYLNELQESKQLILSLIEIINMTSMVNYMQFTDNFDLEKYIQGHSNLFVNLPTLFQHFSDIIKYTWQGYSLQKIEDWDTLGDGKYDPNTDNNEELR